MLAQRDMLRIASRACYRASMPKTMQETQQEALRLATVTAQKFADLCKEYEDALEKIETLGGEAASIANEVLRKYRGKLDS